MSIVRTRFVPLLFLTAMILVGCFSGGFCIAQTPEPSVTPVVEHTVAVRGKVKDSRTGEGIAKSLVAIQQQSLRTITDAQGGFSFPQVTPGEAELYVSTVGYGVVKTRLEVPDDRDLEAEVLLGQEASKPNETVTVEGSPLDPVQPGVVSSHDLNNSELKNLAMVIVNDPLRSVHTLPGVTTSDDYNAQFSLRGLGFSKVGVYVDGVLLSNPFHAAEDIQESGSVTLFNSDLVDSLELIPGGFPAKYGEHLGGILDIRTRSGSRERMFTRADIGMAGLEASSEGPIGRSHRASWLVSGRKSYIGTLLREWGANYLAVGYSDLQSKLSYHPAVNHELTLIAMLGAGWVEPAVDAARYSHIKRAQDSTEDLNLGWTWTISPSAVLHSQVSYLHQQAWNRDVHGDIPYQSWGNQKSAQQELGLQLPGNHYLTAGWSQRWGDEKLASDYYDLLYTNFLVSAHYNQSAGWSTAYLQDTWDVIRGKLQLDFGGRLERFSPTGQELWMPRASLALHVTENNKLTLSWGEYGEFPAFRQLWGEINNPSLRAERATHYLAGIEHRLNDKTRIKIEAYEIRQREGIFSPGQEWRLSRPLDLEHGLVPVRGVLLPQLGPYLRNTLVGRSRGIDIMLQRRSANRLSGWVSYSYGASAYTDPVSELSFWGDFDQRHTINAYGSYRISKTINLSGKYRFGSNFPVPGFYSTDGKDLFFSQLRNQVRLNDYSRLDFRLSKAIYTRRRKFTLYTEVGNVLNRSNRGCQVHSIIQSAPSCDSEFPILPSAGLALEF